MRVHNSRYNKLSGHVDQSRLFRNRDRALAYGLDSASLNENDAVVDRLAPVSVDDGSADYRDYLRGPAIDRVIIRHAFHSLPYRPVPQDTEILVTRRPTG